MKTKSILTALLVLAASVTPVGAQFIGERLEKGQDTVAAVAGSTTGYNPILIRYIGSSPAGGTVAVDAATGDITLETGTVASSTADLTVECPVSGALGGIIDVSNAACDTLGEVVDSINGSANWRAVIQDGLRSDSSNNTLTTLAETSASVPAGLALAGDTTVSLNVTLLLAPVRNDIRPYLNENHVTRPLNANPFNDSQHALWFATWTSAGTGADLFDVIFSKPSNQTCTYGASAVACSASETNQTLSVIGGTTGVNKEFNFTRYGLFSPPGYRLLVRGRYATTHTAVTLFSAGGRQFPKPTGR